MHPDDPVIARRRERIRTLLIDRGVPIAALGRDMGGPLDVSQQRVYHYARQAGLPHNRAMKEGGPKEQRILSMLASGYTKRQVCQVHSISLVVLERIVQRVREERLDNPG